MVNARDYLTYKDTCETDFTQSRVIFGGNGSGKTIFETKYCMKAGEGYNVLEVISHPNGEPLIGNPHTHIIKNDPYKEFVVQVADQRIRLHSGWFLKPS